MLLDDALELADGWSVAGPEGVTLWSDVVDLGNGSVNPGVADLWLVLSVDDALASAGSSTIQFALASDAQADIATDGSATIHFATADLDTSLLVAGFHMAVGLPVAPEYERFLGVLVAITGDDVAEGRVSAAIVNGKPTSWVATPSAI